MDTLKLSIFTNAGTVPLEIAQRQGFFENEGLTVEVEGTTSSIAQMTGVIDGRYDIAATAIDNPIAYNCGQGAAPTQSVSNLRVFLGSASYRLPFVVSPDIENFADLKGRVIAVDALDTGFAFLLREMLEINGVGPNDIEFVSVGAPKERWQAIEQGTAVGALLNNHFEAIAHNNGLRTLKSDPDPWDCYQGNAFCAGPAFLVSDKVEPFTRAVLKAVTFTKNPANAAAVADALVEHLGNLAPEKAMAVAQSLQGENAILTEGLPVSKSGIETVLRLREKYTSKRLNLTPEDLCDPRVLMVQ